MKNRLIIGSNSEISKYFSKFYSQNKTILITRNNKKHNENEYLNKIETCLKNFNIKIIYIFIGKKFTKKEFDIDMNNYVNYYLPKKIFNIIDKINKKFKIIIFGTQLEDMSIDKHYNHNEYYYAKSKQRLNRYLIKKKLEFKSKILYVKLPSVYGKNIAKKSLINSIIISIKKNNFIKINNLHSKHHFLYIEDLCRLLKKIEKNEKKLNITNTLNIKVDGYGPIYIMDIFKKLQYEKVTKNTKLQNKVINKYYPNLYIQNKNLIYYIKKQICK